MSSQGRAKPRRTSSPRVDVEHLEVVLRALRERLEVTQKEIADRAEVSAATIARLEAGDRRPSRDILARLAEVFDTTPAGLIEAARSVAAGQVLDGILDALPGRVVAEAQPAADLPAEVAGDYAAPDPGSSHPPQPAREPETAAQRHARLAYELLADLPDPDRAAGLLREVAGWLHSHPGLDLTAVHDELRDVLSRPERGSEPVAAMPTGEIRYVFTHAISRDERGQLWIDPLTRARTGGYDEQDPRVERYEDGRIIIDTTRLNPSVTFTHRDRTRHRTCALVEGGVEGAAGSPAVVDTQIYADTVLEIQWDADTRMTLTPRPDGTVDGDLPDDVDHIDILTASNPRNRLLRPSENDERNRLLRAELDAAGLHHRPATARSPNSSWAEHGFAIIDADEQDILHLAQRYEQTAIHRWTPTHLKILWTTPDQPAIEAGWVRSG